MEQVPTLVAPRGSITKRAVRWAIGQLRREHATVHGLARQLGTSWKTVWRAVEPGLVKLAEDEFRFENVTTLGVDEHIWSHSTLTDRDAVRCTDDQHIPQLQTLLARDPLRPRSFPARFAPISKKLFSFGRE